MPAMNSSVDAVVDEARRTMPVSATTLPPTTLPPTTLPYTLLPSTPLPPTPLPSTTTERTAERTKAQWYHDLRAPLQKYFETRLPLYQCRNQGSSYVLLWADGSTIHERFFADTVALYGWMVAPENKHLCGPQSVEYFVTPQKPCEPATKDQKD